MKKFVFFNYKNFFNRTCLQEPNLVLYKCLHSLLSSSILSNNSSLSSSFCPQLFLFICIKDLLLISLGSTLFLCCFRNPFTSLLIFIVLLFFLLIKGKSCEFFLSNFVAFALILILLLLLFIFTLLTLSLNFENKFVGF